jgi:hypothetical protein
MAKNNKKEPSDRPVITPPRIPGAPAPPARPSRATEQPPANDGQAADTSGAAARIAGLSVLKGLVLYGATLTFAGFYAYFMHQIASAPSAKPPTFSPAMVGAAAALAGVLGSAFSLIVGTPTKVTNEGLARTLDATERGEAAPKSLWLRKLLSLEPGGTTRASYPLTFGIWAYAIVASAVAIVYFLNPGETPDTVKALATAFAGYVVAFITVAYGLATQAPPQTGTDG